MRDPGAELAERLATGAGDLATAVTGVLRMLGQGAGRARGGGGRADVDHAHPEGDDFWDSMRRKAADAARAAALAGRPDAADDPWRQATSAPSIKPMAKKAVAKRTEQGTKNGTPAVTKAAAAKAVKKAAATKAVKKAAAAKAVKKAAAAKTVTKAAA